MKNNQAKTLLYLCLIAAAGSATTHSGCNPQMPALKSARKPYKPQGGENIVVFYVNGKEIGTLEKSAEAVRRQFRISGCGDYHGLASIDEHASSNRIEIHVHLPGEESCQTELIAQLMDKLIMMWGKIRLQFMHELTSMWGKLKCSQPAVAQVNGKGTIGALFGAKFLTEDNIGIIHLRFDGLVGASGLSPDQAPPPSLGLGENTMWVGDYSDATSGHGGAIDAIYSANFITKGNIGTIHIHLPTDLDSGIRRLFEMCTGLERVLPRVLSCVLKLYKEAHSNHSNTADRPLTANLIAQSNRGALHLDFDDFVRASECSGECTPHEILQKLLPDTHGETYRTNFIPTKNIGTIHLY
jgi:hypothetical protein